MPTLVEVEVAAETEDDASVTILQDESTILDCTSPSAERQVSNRLDRQGSNQGSPGEFTLDDSATILSKTLLGEGPSPICEQDPGVNGAKGARSNLNLGGGSSSRQQNPRPRPNMNSYRMKYHSYVQDTIGKYIERHPGKLRDYRSMSSDEKLEEQQRVVALLARLEIGKSAGMRANLEQNRGFNDLSLDQPDSFYHCGDDVTISPIHTPNVLAHKHRREEESNENQEATSERELPSHEFLNAEASMLLLSPISRSSKVEHSSKSDHQKMPPANRTPDKACNTSVDSVEIARAHQSVSSTSNAFDSPERIFSNPQKRIASTSGKRGADLARFRHNSDIRDNDDLSPPLQRRNGHSAAEAAPNLQLEMLSMPSPSPDRGEIFAASQSPISPRMTCPSSESDESCGPGGSLFPVFDDDGEELVENHDRESIYSYGSNTRRTPQHGKFASLAKRPQLREIPANVALKEGATFHLEALDTKRNEKRRIGQEDNSLIGHRQLVNFPDPLARYGDREKDRLTNVFQWIQQVDQRREDDYRFPAGAIFSLLEQQLVDVTLKLVLEDKRDDLEASGEGHLTGQTVIVARDKEDLITWECAFRENTGCSVLNHATLSNGDRKRASTAKRCTMFDVVLTTFDAIKSPDIATPVDDLGYVITTKDTNDRGWYSSRTGSHSALGAQKCKQFSVLHQVHFRRIIFADVLGRKCFLAKKNTARASAAVALQGDTRIVFFCGEEDTGSSAMTALMKSDRMALDSLAAVLRLQECEKALEEILEDHLLDLKCKTCKKRKAQKGKRKGQLKS